MLPLQVELVDFVRTSQFAEPTGRFRAARLLVYDRRMQCDVCACGFEPVGSAWPDRCGTCIAAEIEQRLMCPLFGLGDRKPLRRATAAAEPGVEDNRQENAA